MIILACVLVAYVVFTVLILALMASAKRGDKILELIMMGEHGEHTTHQAAVKKNN